MAGICHIIGNGSIGISQSTRNHQQSGGLPMTSQKNTKSTESTQEFIDKACTRCGALRPMADFYKDRRSKDGRVSMCKLCRSAGASAWRKANPGENAARSRRWRKANPIRAKEMDRLHYVRNRASIMAKNKLTHRSNPEKGQAHSAAWEAVKSGKLSIPASCSQCGMKCRPDAHHPSYLPEHRLDVIWLCRSCHKLLHAEPGMAPEIIDRATSLV